MAALSFNPSSWETAFKFEFEASLIHIETSKSPRAPQ